MWDAGIIDVKTIYEYPLSVKWHIENYFQRRPKADAYYQSPKFTFAKSTWCLRLYPNGSSNYETVGNVELYLEKLHSPIESHEVSFTMGIKNGDDTVYISEQFTKSFEGRNQLRGTDKIATKSQLFRYKQNLAPKKRLTVFIENLVLTRNVVTEDDDETSTDDDQTSTSTDEENLENIENEEPDSPPADLEGEENAEDIHNEMKVSPSSYIEGEENYEDIKNETKIFPPSYIEGEENYEDIKNETKISSPSYIEGVELLAKNLKDLFLNEEECDVTIKVENREFRAHLAVLVARSAVFASMFRHDMSEKNTGIVNIPDCSAEAFKELLLYLYSGTVTHSSLDITFDLYEASVKYDLEHLKANCVHFMKEDMSVDTFCDILAITLKHNEMEIIKIATNFFTQHTKIILPTMKWQTFMKENHIEANELFMKAMENK